jgi:hypothetical protein
MVIQASQDKALAAFIDAIAAIPRISLSRARIADFFQSLQCKNQAAAAGKVLMQQDELSSVVMYLVSGSVCVVQNGEKRASIQAPAMFGHHSFIYRRARTAAIVCESHVAYFQVCLDDLLASAGASEAAQPVPSSPVVPTELSEKLKANICSPTILQPMDPSHVQTASHVRDASPSHGVYDSSRNSAALAVSELESAHFGKHSLITSNLRPTHVAAPLSYITQQHHSSASDFARSAAPASFASAQPSVGRSSGGMSVSDSLGMMMRQHHVRCLVHAFA